LHAGMIAFRMYLNESRDTMPLLSKTKPSIRMFLQPYLSFPESMRCPADKKGEFFILYGSSYNYNNIELGGQRLEYLIKTYGLQTPIIWDYKPLHGPRWQQSSMNCLYLDGSVGKRLW
jgi:prepilin-type processing-associated H-X9-DG protein